MRNPLKHGDLASDVEEAVRDAKDRHAKVMNLQRQLKEGSEVKGREQ